jgi:3-keto-L-gulonate-6-phosphate decarboxylase
MGIEMQVTGQDGASIGAAITKTGYSAVPVAVFGGLTANELAAFGGLAVAVIGLIVGQGINWFYKHREDARAEREHAQKLRDMDDARSGWYDRRQGGADTRQEAVERRKEAHRG